jgi:hypothetical protein
VTGYSYVGNAAGGTLTINAGGAAYTLNFVGDFDNLVVRFVRGTSTVYGVPA